MNWIFTERFVKLLLSLGGIIIIVGIIMFCNKDLLFQLDEQIKSDKVGQLGDFIGGIAGSIWALAGVILFYIALQSQKESLNDQKRATQAAIDAVLKQSDSIHLQIKEISLQREEMAKSSNAQNKSQIALNNQLHNMINTSRIEMLNRYLEISKDTFQISKTNDSKKIIEKLVNQIFLAPEFSSLVTPDVVLLNEECDIQYESNVFSLIFHVIGSGIESLEIRYYDKNDSTFYKRKYESLEEGTKINFNLQKFKSLCDITLEFKSASTDKYFRKRYTININLEKVNILEIK